MKNPTRRGSLNVTTVPTVWVLLLIALLGACERLPGDVLVTPTPIPTPVPLPKAVHPVTRGDIVDSVTLLGLVDSRRRENLSFRIAGRLNRFHVRPGDGVEAGQLLAELDVGFLPHELAKAEKQLEIAQLRLEAAEGTKSLAVADAQATLSLDKLGLDQARAGAQDEERGEAIHLCVVPRPGAELDLAGLRDWARSRLDRFKLPDHLHLRAELPLGSTGKADRRALRRMVEPG